MIQKSQRQITFQILPIHLFQMEQNQKYYSSLGSPIALCDFFKVFFYPVEIQ